MPNVRPSIRDGRHTTTCMYRTAIECLRQLRLSCFVDLDLVPSAMSSSSTGRVYAVTRGHLPSTIHLTCHCRAIPIGE